MKADDAERAADEHLLLRLQAAQASAAHPLAMMGLSTP